MLQLEVDALTEGGEPDKAMALLDRSGELYVGAKICMYVYMYVCMYVCMWDRFKKSYKKEDNSSETDALMEVTLILLKASIMTAKVSLLRIHTYIHTTYIHTYIHSYIRIIFSRRS